MTARLDWTAFALFVRAMSNVRVPWAKMSRKIKIKMDGSLCDETKSRGSPRYCLCLPLSCRDGELEAHMPNAKHLGGLTGGGGRFKFGDFGLQRVWRRSEVTPESRPTMASTVRIGKSLTMRTNLMPAAGGRTDSKMSCVHVAAEVRASGKAKTANVGHITAVSEKEGWLTYGYMAFIVQGWIVDGGWVGGGGVFLALPPCCCAALA